MIAWKMIVGVTMIAAFFALGGLLVLTLVGLAVGCAIYTIAQCVSILVSKRKGTQ